MRGTCKNNQGGGGSTKKQHNAPDQEEEGHSLGEWFYTEGKTHQQLLELKQTAEHGRKDPQPNVINRTKH